MTQRVTHQPGIFATRSGRNNLLLDFQSTRQSIPISSPRPGKKPKPPHSYEGDHPPPTSPEVVSRKCVSEMAFALVVLKNDALHSHKELIPFLLLATSHAPACMFPPGCGHRTERVWRRGSSLPPRPAPASQKHTPFRPPSCVNSRLGINTRITDAIARPALSRPHQQR